MSYLNFGITFMGLIFKKQLFWDGDYIVLGMPKTLLGIMHIVLGINLYLFFLKISSM